MNRPVDPAVARPRGRPRLFDRDAALHTAMLLFWRHGFEGTSMNRLVEAMGITAPSIYAAFGSKEALFEEATALYLRDEGGAAWRALHGEPNARDAIAAMLKAAAALFTTSARPRGCLLVLWGAGDIPTSEGLRRARARLREAVRARLVRGRDDGDLSADAEIDALTALYVAFHEGISIEAADGATRVQLDAAVDRLMEGWPGGTA